ncbi:hypothetical protein Hypma_003132 [Hypsizygus marmoreus]|uniref:BTB domain-containing protein n=1 Tax=Hypsizygus marmoreus TaxID=39966 RepID=A0A369JBJ1_HYPMA|nr:hypothetical protein Hypma_003132 [Hypsizygus marmoreus]
MDSPLTPGTQDAIDCLYCGMEVDVILESSDGSRFGAHRKNLETYSEGFPPASAVIQKSEETSSEDAIVKMTENGKVIQLLLHFMHLRTQPDLRSISFDVLDALANAVEKYLVYSAMQICNFQMEAAIRDHPLEVLRYAVRNNYSEIANAAAPLTISRDFETIETTFGADSVIPYRWLRYSSNWMKVVAFIHETDPLPIKYKGSFHVCDSWNLFRDAVVRRVGVRPGALLDITQIINEYKAWVPPCEKCRERSQLWKTSIMSEIEKIPKFTTLL